MVKENTLGLTKRKTMENETGKTFPALYHSFGRDYYCPLLIKKTAWLESEEQQFQDLELMVREM